MLASYGGRLNSCSRPLPSMARSSQQTWTTWLSRQYLWKPGRSCQRSGLIVQWGAVAAASLHEGSVGLCIASWRLLTFAMLSVESHTAASVRPVWCQALVKYCLAGSMLKLDLVCIDPMNAYKRTALGFSCMPCVHMACIYLLQLQVMVRGQGCLAFHASLCGA